MGKALDGPEDLCPGLLARPASRQSSHFEGLSRPLSFFSASFCSAFSSVLLGGLTAGAPFCCTCFTEVHADKGMRRQIRILHLHLFLVKLKSSMPCDTPLWRLLLNCLRLPPRLPFAGFRAWQRASSVPSSFLKRSRDNLLCPPSGRTSEPHPAKESEASLPMFLRSSSSSTFRVRGRPLCCNRLQRCLQGFSRRLPCAVPKVASQRRAFSPTCCSGARRRLCTCCSPPSATATQQKRSAPTTLMFPSGSSQVVSLLELSAVDLSSLS